MHKRDEKIFIMTPPFLSASFFIKHLKNIMILSFLSASFKKQIMFNKKCIGFLNVIFTFILFIPIFAFNKF